MFFLFRWFLWKPLSRSFWKLPVATTATRRSRRKQTLGFGTAFLARFEENSWLSVELSVSGRDCLKSAKHPWANCDWGNLLPTGHAGSRSTSFWTDLRHAQRRWDGDRPAPIARYQYCCVLNFYVGCLILRFRGESWRYCDAECCCNVAIVSLEVALSASKFELCWSDGHSQPWETRRPFSWDVLLLCLAGYLSPYSNFSLTLQKLARFSSDKTVSESQGDVKEKTRRMDACICHTHKYLHVHYIKDTDRRGHMYAPTHDAQAYIPSVHPWRDMTWRDFPFHYITLLTLHTYEPLRCFTSD